MFIDWISLLTNIELYIICILQELMENGKTFNALDDYIEGSSMIWMKNMMSLKQHQAMIPLKSSKKLKKKKKLVKLMTNYNHRLNIWDKGTML